MFKFLIKTIVAAHCVDGATSGTIVLGAHFLTNQAEPNQRRIAVPGSAVVLHPNWNALLIRDDVALVRLGAPAPLIPGTNPEIFFLLFVVWLIQSTHFRCYPCCYFTDYE